MKIVFSDIKVNVSFHEGMELEIKQVNEDVEICCHEPAHFFRALNWVQKHLKDTEGKSEKRETAYFTGNGLMLDCSRNAVFTVEKVKEMIRTLAKMGLNRLLLYTEDTYEVADLPYFGAYRGRYTKEEIHSILDALSDQEAYGMILRAKGMVEGKDGQWIYFDMVPGEADVREGAPEYTGRLCVIGSGMKEEKLSVLFGLE